MKRSARFLSWILILAGLALVGLGLRTVFLSFWGQQEAVPPPIAERNAPEIYTPGDLIGRLAIPRLDAQWTLYEGTREAALLRGPGHLEGSANPGTSGNCVIAGHRDTHFRVLKDLRAGDEIVVESARGTFRYRVTGLRIVFPTNTKLIQPEQQPVLTLVTCFPFYYVGPAPKRFIVRAEMISPEEPSSTLTGGRRSKGPGSAPS